MPETLSVETKSTRPADIAKLQPGIDICFGLNSIDAVITALENRDDPGSQDSLNLLRRCSPTSLTPYGRGTHTCLGKSLADVLKENWRISRHMMAGSEFFEGVRALLIERDNTPKWQPATLSEVSAAAVNRYFEKLPDEPDLDLNLK